jgi:hypothetical protein
MRSALLATVAVLVVVLLSGCTVPTKDDKSKTTSPLFGVCPQWVEGAVRHAGTFTLHGPGNQSDFVPGEPYVDGRGLDLLRIDNLDVTVNGTLTLRVFQPDAHGNATDRGYNIVDYRQPGTERRVQVAFTGATKGAVLEIYLNPIDAPADAGGPVLLVWTLEGSDAQLHYEVSQNYRVCGLAK